MPTSSFNGVGSFQRRGRRKIRCGLHSDLCCPFYDLISTSHLIFVSTPYSSHSVLKTLLASLFSLPSSSPKITILNTKGVPQHAHRHLSLAGYKDNTRLSFGARAAGVIFAYLASGYWCQLDKANNSLATTVDEIASEAADCRLAFTMANCPQRRIEEISDTQRPIQDVKPRAASPGTWKRSCQVIYSQFGLAIHQNDHQARRRFVKWARNEIAVVPDFHKRILFSDEAHFWLNGYVNKQNCRIGVKLIHKCHNGTVNGDWYRAMITNFFIPELNNHDVQELWFQQDGATCHTARATIDLLKDTFGDSLISRFGPVNWPPRSCDLTPLDYLLWGYIKSLVCADKPQTLDPLEDNIRRVIADIRPQMLEKVIENWTSRLTTSEPAVAVICQKSYLKCNATRLSFE
ncbi:uncharacterized protein TNCV_4290061 [Trichonephila clavipes]|nr:uncharacterized protein TNCV_4290061 [Trichonephila clavipes]